jgi:hypothetical protein
MSCRDQMLQLRLSFPLSLPLSMSVVADVLLGGVVDVDVLMMLVVAVAGVTLMPPTLYSQDRGREAGCNRGTAEAAVAACGRGAGSAVPAAGHHR